jgi:hypothetical protein
MWGICLTQVIALASAWWGGPPWTAADARLLAGRPGGRPRARAPAPHRSTERGLPASSRYPTKLFPDRSLIRHRIASPYARSRLAWRRNAESEEKSTPQPGFSVPSVPSRRSLTTRSLRPKRHNSHQISGIADHEVAPCGIAESSKSPHKLLTSYLKMIKLHIQTDSGPFALKEVCWVLSLRKKEWTFR